jgi:hypothetical protein
VDAGGAAPDVSLRRRPSWLLTRLLPGVAAVLALGCWALALLPYVLDPLPRGRATFGHVEFDPAVAGDRFAPFRPGAGGRPGLVAAYVVYGCLFAANVWMLPRLTRLAPTVAAARGPWGVLVGLGVPAGTVALVAFGYRPLMVTARLTGGHVIEGYASNVIEMKPAYVELWWVGCGAALLLLDLTLLAVVGLARFGLGGAKLLPRGQVATFRDGKGLAVIRWLGGLSLACFLLTFAQMTTGLALRVGSWDFGLIFTSVGGLLLSMAFLLYVLWWTSKYLLLDDGSPSPPPNAQSATMPPSVRLSASGAAPSAGRQAIRPGSEREGFGEPDRR